MKTFNSTFGFIFLFLSLGFTQNCPIAINYATDYASMQVAKVKVNFHFLPINPVFANPTNPSQATEYTQIQAETLAAQLISFANYNFSHMQQTNFDSPNGVKYTIGDAKIQLELYDGGQGSVFLYSGPGNTFQNTNTHTTRYGQGEVLDIVISYSVNCTSNGASRDLSYIRLCNFDQQILSNSTMQENRSLLLCHEVGHIFSLKHSFQCGQCDSEIVHTIECSGNCTCGTPNNNTFARAQAFE